MSNGKLDPMVYFKSFRSQQAFFDKTLGQTSTNNEQTEILRNAAANYIGDGVMNSVVVSSNSSSKSCESEIKKILMEADNPEDHFALEPIGKRTRGAMYHEFALNPLSEDVRRLLKVGNTSLNVMARQKSTEPLLDGNLTQLSEFVVKAAYIRIIVCTRNLFYSINNVHNSDLKRAICQFLLDTDLCIIKEMARSDESTYKTPSCMLYSFLNNLLVPNPLRDTESSLLDMKSYKTSDTLLCESSIIKQHTPYEVHLSCVSKDILLYTLTAQLKIHFADSDDPDILYEHKLHINSPLDANVCSRSISTAVLTKFNSYQIVAPFFTKSRGGSPNINILPNISFTFKSTGKRCDRGDTLYELHSVSLYDGIPTSTNSPMVWLVDSAETA